MQIRKLRHVQDLRCTTLVTLLCLAGAGCDARDPDDDDAVAVAKEHQPSAADYGRGGAFGPGASSGDTIRGSGNIVIDDTAGATGTDACEGESGVVGSELLASESRELAPFSRLELTGVFDAELTLGAEAVVLRMEDNLLPLTETEVREGTLYVHHEANHCYRIHDKPTLSIASPSLGAIRVDGASSVRGETKGAQAELAADGASKLDLRLAVAGEVSAHADGSSEIKLAGSAARLTLVAGGAAAIDSELEATQVSVLAAGVAKVRVRARDSVQIEVSGRARVTVLGNPVRREIKGDAGAVTFEK